MTPLLGNRYRLGGRIATGGMGVEACESGRAAGATGVLPPVGPVLAARVAGGRAGRARTRRAGAAAAGALVVAAPLLLAWRPLPDGGPPSGSSTAGRTVAEVPSVVGLDVAEAERRLRAVGFDTEVTVAGGGKGRKRVRVTRPGAGTPVERDTTARLVVEARGKGRNGGNGDGDD